MRPYPDAPSDLLERVVEVMLFENRIDREGELVLMAKTHGLSCFEEVTGRTAVLSPRRAPEPRG